MKDKTKQTLKKIGIVTLVIMLVYFGFSATKGPTIVIKTPEQ